MPDVRFYLADQWFVYDSDKEAINRRKHGISFRTAAHVFMDMLRLDFPDELHSTAVEERWITIGLVRDVLTVVYAKDLKMENMRCD